jgi:acyl-coenzyme A thioesterase PaaI-like protein
MEPNTHLALSRTLCGTPRVLEVGVAEVELETSEDMRADERGLVHGGFIFGLADHAAMLAINAPNVVLGSAETRFLAPVVAGERLRATARVLAVEGKRHRVEAEVWRGDERVFEGSFVCFVPAQHVLSARTGAAS